MLWVRKQALAVSTNPLNDALKAVDDSGKTHQPEVHQGQPWDSTEDHIENVSIGSLRPGV